MILKKTITESVTREVEKEVSFPFYGRQDQYGTPRFIMAKSVDRAIMVMVAEKWSTISVHHLDCSSEIASADEITADEFEAAYHTAMNMLEQQLAVAT